MTWGWGLLLGLSVVIVILLLLPVRVEVHFKREGMDDRLHLGVRALFGIVRLGYDIPVVALMERTGKIAIKKEPAHQMPESKKGWVTLTIEEIDKGMRKLNDVRKRIGKYKRAIRRLTRSFRLEQTTWKTKFGTGDAAQTGWLTGLGWGLKGVCSGVLYRYFTVESRIVYDVQPHFRAKGFRSEFTCIIRFCPGKTMIAGLTLVILWVMEGIKWRSIRFKG
ncbi:DUF2953 domain-containing protein [Tumebacillus permanentifrigoris]|uniref:DUF2953 family protein n=1 Tax=Tumebacillus permanentifrigoris TaxID=378543 RepID=A0A316DAB9_9BACL|nr:DUF2953 domain-containing protein [Tumebacillus permanentifrigoris]PWK14441.1 hypothetical protein C7459_105199 [Tumebacillus permanentifrigoris]